MTRTTSPKPREISWFSFWFLAAVMVGVEAAALLLMWLCPSLSDTELSTFAVYGTMFLVIGLYMLLHKRGFREIGFRKIGFSDVLISVCLGILIQPGAMLISYLSSFIFTDIVTDAINQELFETPLLLLIVYTAIVPAVFEETATRGIILFGYRKSLPRWALILFPSLVFGIMHGNATQFLYATVMGCIFAVMDLDANSIFPSMISHFTLNATQTLLAAWTSTLDYTEEAYDAAEAAAFDPEALMIYLVLTGLSLPLIIGCLKRLRNNGLRRKAQEPDLTAVPAADVLPVPETDDAMLDALRASLTEQPAEQPSAETTADGSPRKLPPFREMMPLYAGFVLGLILIALMEWALRTLM